MRSVAPGHQVLVRHRTLLFLLLDLDSVVHGLSAQSRLTQGMETTLLVAGYKDDFH
jgi:hypothetical protein